LKASEDKVLHANLEDILLSRADVKDFIEGEGSVFANYKLVVLIITLNYDIRRLKQFSTN
jgi:hypothetical protein